MYRALTNSTSSMNNQPGPDSFKSQYAAAQLNSVNTQSHFSEHKHRSDETRMHQAPCKRMGAGGSIVLYRAGNHSSSWGVPKAYKDKKRRRFIPQQVVKEALSVTIHIALSPKKNWSPTVHCLQHFYPNVYTNPNTKNRI